MFFSVHTRLNGVLDGIIGNQEVYMYTHVRIVVNAVIT